MTGLGGHDKRAAGAEERRGVSLSASLPSVALGGLVLGFFGFCYADVFRTLWIQWTTNEANSHGFLIPWISLWVMWVRRERLAALRADPAWWAGLLVLIPSLCVLAVGRLVGIVGLQEGSLVVSLAGVVLLLIGWRGLRVLWFPIGYLLFMMPIWDLATERMYYPLQVFAATLGTRILTAAGVPVFRDGTFLHLPNATLQVAYACSGINFLMSVLAVGILFAYISLYGVWRRLALVAVSVAVALLANPLRVALIAYSYYTGMTTSHQSHMWQGMVVSIGAFALLFAASNMLAAHHPPPLRPAGDELPAGTRWGSRHRLAVSNALACALLALGGIARPLNFPALSLSGLDTARISYAIGDWRAPFGGHSQSLTAGVIMPDELWREYSVPSGGSLRLYVGRFAHPNMGQGGVGYWSERFMDIKPAPVVDGVPGDRPMNSAMVVEAGRRTPVLYWYQLGSRQTTNRVAAKLYGAWCAVTGVHPGPAVVVIFLAETGSRGDPDGTGPKAFARGVAEALSSAGPR